MPGIGLFFSKGEIRLRTAIEQYLAGKARVTPSFIACICDVNLEGRNINSIHSRFSKCGWAVQLPIIKAIFFLADLNFRSSSLTQSSKSYADIQSLR